MAKKNVVEEIIKAVEDVPRNSNPDYYREKILEVLNTFK